MIQIERKNDRLAVSAPYTPDFPPAARNLGGRWDAAKRVWTFDARDESRVRELCRGIYGDDGISKPDTVTVLVPASTLTENQYWIGGRCVASRRYRDYSVRLGDGVVVISGSFPRSGGSMKHPRLAPSPDLTLEVRDVPRPLAEQLAAIGQVTIVPPSSPSDGDNPEDLIFGS